MAEQIIIGFPYYSAESHDGISNKVTVTFNVVFEGSIGSATEDSVADGIRDYLAALSGATGSSLKRTSLTQATL